MLWEMKSQEPFPCISVFPSTHIFKILKAKQTKTCKNLQCSVFIEVLLGLFCWIKKNEIVALSRFINLQYV